MHEMNEVFEVVMTAANAFIDKSEAIDPTVKAGMKKDFAVDMFLTFYRNMRDYDRREFCEAILLDPEKF